MGAIDTVYTMKTANMVKVTIDDSQGSFSPVIVLSDRYYEVHYCRPAFLTHTEKYAFDSLVRYCAEYKLMYVYLGNEVNPHDHDDCISVRILLGSCRELKVWITPDQSRRLKRASKGGREPSVLQRNLHVHVDVPVDYTGEIARQLGQRIMALATQVASASSPEEHDLAKGRLLRLVGGEA